MFLCNICFQLRNELLLLDLKSWLKLFVIAIIILLTSILSTSCADGSINGQAVEETNSYTVYPVVGLFPLSGNFSDYGKAMEAAARLAEEDVNNWLKENDKQWRLKIETPDTRHFGSNAREQMQDWHEKGVEFFIGPTSYESVRSCLYYSKNNNLLMISPSANSVELAEASSYFYSFNPKISDQALAITAAAADTGIKYLVPVSCNRDYTQHLQQEVHLAAESYEVDVSQNKFIFDCSGIDFSESIIELEAYIKELTEDGMEIYEIGITFLATKQSLEYLISVAERETLQELLWFGNNWLAKSGDLVSDDLIPDFTSNVAFISPKLNIVETPADSKNTHVKMHLDQDLDEDIKLFAYNTYDIIWSLALSLDQGGYNVEKVEKLLSTKTRNWTKEHGASGYVVLNEYGNRVDSDYEYWAVNQNRSWQKIGGFIGRNKTTDWQNDLLSELIKKKQEQADDEYETEALGPVEYDEPFEKRYANDDTFTKHRFEERGNTVGNIIYRGTALTHEIFFNRI